MDIYITIWRTITPSGYDTGPFINTVHVRYPDLNRVKGQPHDIQDYYNIKAIQFWDPEAINKLGEPGARNMKPDYEEIEKIIEKYRSMGNVILMDNNLF